MSAPRYAIYYAPPPGAVLWTFGSAVLGYDAATGETRPLLAPEGVSPEDWARITAQPRRYGFHATLKAPFRLADGASEDDLVMAGREFARGWRTLTLPRLEVSAIEGFVALATETPSPELYDLAAATVEAFEPFRGQPSPEEAARRAALPLTDRQRASLDRWGYPFVFEDFRFHMTLTGPLPSDAVSPVVAGLSRIYAERVGDAKTPLDAVTLYVEEDPAIGFRIVDRFVFGG